MTRIAYLKRLVFSLEEIVSQLEQNRCYIDRELIQSEIEQCNSEMERLKWRLTELETTLHKQEKVMEKVFKKSLPEIIFATHRRKIESFQELFDLCPNVIGPEMVRLGCQCPEPQYCFTVEYNEEYGVDIEYFEAVAGAGEDSDLVKLISARGACCTLYQSLANGYEPSDRARFCYIDGIWNKESVDFGAFR